jgi:FixJ family two-component response regulator
MAETTQSICILDDDSSVLNSLQELLASDGFAAQTFDSPEKFLSYARERTVNLAVLDVWMPTTNGIEVLARLQELSPDTRVIMITAREEPAVRTGALEGGALAFLIKPFDDEEFLSLVRTALREAAA